MGFHIHTTLTADEAKLYARHAARVHRGYVKRFGMPEAREAPMPVYLFRTQWEYVNHLAKLDINASNSDGVYFESADQSGLALFVEGRSANETFALFQHEGFHQFSAGRFRHRLPMFLEEGLATYFQDGLLYHGKLHYGGKPTDRIENLHHLVRTDRALPLAELMALSPEQWHEYGRADPTLLSDMYHQSWAIVHAILHGTGSWRESLRDYLNRVAESEATLNPAQWLPCEQLETYWRHHVMRMKPDPLTVLIDRLIYLGYALAWLDETRQRMPTSTEELQRRLRIHGFEVLRRSPRGVTFRQTPRDEMFQYATEEGLVVEFDTLPNDRPGLPPRIQATAIEGRPHLAWFRDTKRKLVPHIVFEDTKPRCNDSPA